MAMAVFMGGPNRSGHDGWVVVSALANYRLDHFSVERLMSFLNALDHDVEIVIRPSREAVGQTSVHALR